MPSRNERKRARAHRAETPSPVDDDNLRKVEEEAGAIIREAQGNRSPCSMDLLTSAVDDVSRSYYQYLMRRRRGHRPPGGDA
jgi:hypothetical protein